MQKWKAGYGQFLRFAVTGVINTALDFGVLYLLVEFAHWLVPPAKIISTSVGMLNSFFLNKYWTFRDHRNMTRKQVVQFLVISIIGLLLSTGLITLFVSLFNIWYIAANLLTVLIVLFWNFWANRQWTFNR